MSLNRDVVIALVLLGITVVLFWETSNIPIFDYSSMGSAVWPRIILTPLLVLCVAYLVQSLRKVATAKGEGMSLIQVAVTYRNPILSFLIFFVFLLTIDYLGMLLGGGALVFGLLTILGRRTPRALLLHAAIALMSVGLMWALFTFVLRVYLPEGELLHVY